MSASRASAASTIGLAAALAAVSVVARGGTDLDRSTWVEIALVLAAAGIVALAALLSPAGPLYGGLAVAGLAALAALSAISILWSVAPELSFSDAARLLAYLAVFAASVGAARLAPRAAPCVVGAVLLACAAVLAWALAAQVWPTSFATQEFSNRIGEPFGYWNALGTVAAMMVPASLWLGSRRAGRATLGALAYPALGAAVLIILLTKSRGAAGAALLATALWYLLVPLRLRSLPVLVASIVGAAPVAAWALSKDAFSKTPPPLAAKESVAGDFGLLVLLMLTLLLLAGLAVQLGSARYRPPMRLRRRAGVAAIAAVALIPLGLITSAAFSDRGFSDTISDRVDELTSQEIGEAGEGAGRLVSTSNSRGATWREAGDVWERHRLAGAGSNSFGIARLRYRSTEKVSQHAHGFVPQTLADLGLVGLGVSLPLLAAWLAAALRTTRLMPRARRAAERPRRDWDGDRIALVALLLVALAFGLQSLIDWTWFVHGPAVTALVAAGYVAGRGAAPGPHGERPPRTVGRIAAAAGIGLAAVLVAWAIYQPLRAQHMSDEALRLADQGDFAAARAKADDALDTDPLSPQPLFALAAVERNAGDLRRAEAALARSVQRFPADPDTWLQLATFQLQDRDDPESTLVTLRGALYVDPRSTPARNLFLAARARAREQKADGRPGSEPG